MEKKPHSFCETPEENCTMNYCDDNGCQNRKRELVNPELTQLRAENERLKVELAYYKDRAEIHYCECGCEINEPGLCDLCDELNMDQQLEDRMNES
jgi:hypothetical protein